MPSFELLSLAGDYAEEVLVGSLDELWPRRLVREVDEEAYDFSHDKIRDVVYARLSRPQRQMLHRRLAQALEIVYAGNLEPMSGRIAEQYAQAGEPLQAFDYWIRAADRAANLYAYSEAEALYAQAIALAARQPLSNQRLADLYARRGRMLEHVGQFEEAVQLYRGLRDLAERQGDKAMGGFALARLVSCYIEPNAIHDL